MATLNESEYLALLSYEGDSFATVADVREALADELDGWEISPELNHDSDRGWFWEINLFHKGRGWSTELSMAIDAGIVTDRSWNEVDLSASETKRFQRFYDALEAGRFFEFFDPEA